MTHWIDIFKSSMPDVIGMCTRSIQSERQAIGFNVIDSTWQITFEKTQLVKFGYSIKGKYPQSSEKALNLLSLIFNYIPVWCQIFFIYIDQSITSTEWMLCLCPVASASTAGQTPQLLAHPVLPQDLSLLFAVKAPYVPYTALFIDYLIVQ